MNQQISPRTFLGIPAAALLLSLSAAAAPGSVAINACYQKDNHVIRIVHEAANCRSDEEFVVLTMETSLQPAPAKPSAVNADTADQRADAPAEDAAASPAPARSAAPMATAPSDDARSSPNGVGLPKHPNSPGTDGPPANAGTPFANSTKGPPETATGVWNADTSYIPGDTVTYNGSTYICVVANTDVVPTTTADWSYIVPGFSQLFGSNSIGFGSGSGSGASCTLGTLLLSASVIYPTNYLPADGRTIQIEDNTALFSLIGTNYGGNGTTNYQLPDLRPVAPNNTQYLICYSGVFP